MAADPMPYAVRLTHLRKLDNFARSKRGPACYGSRSTWQHECPILKQHRSDVLVGDSHMTVTCNPRPASRALFVVVFGLGGFAFVGSSRASILDFELTPVGTIPVDNATLNNAYTIPGGTARLFFDLNGNNAFDAGVDALPVFEHKGNDTTRAFISQFAGDNVDDTARNGYGADLGEYFLRTPAGQGNGPVPGPFIVAYSTTTTITELSGEIWDIDGTEQWRVDALSGAGAILASTLSPSFGGSVGPETLDGLPWTFSFTNLPAGFTSVRLTYVGTDPDGVAGLSFNNFSPTIAVVPESTVGMALLPAGALLIRRRK